MEIFHQCFQCTPSNLSDFIECSFLLQSVTQDPVAVGWPTAECCHDRDLQTIGSKNLKTTDRGKQLPPSADRACSCSADREKRTPRLTLQSGAMPTLPTLPCSPFPELEERDLSDEFAENTDNRFTHFSTGEEKDRHQQGLVPHHITYTTTTPRRNQGSLPAFNKTWTNTKNALIASWCSLKGTTLS